ncbi:MAG: hypothetical protein K6E85_15535 [Lachnospiraceae bacterium]|nr:hypothetical protein [Lachnospiraceae bacterium]
MAKRNKYSFDAKYYESFYRKAYNGSAARKTDALDDYIDNYEDDEEEYENLEMGEADYIEPSQHYEKHPEVKNSQEPKIKVRRKADIDIFYMAVMVLALVILLASAFKMLETKSDLTQADKKIAIAKNELADVTALNDSLKATLDTQLDRNYIYSVAVGKLGMVYPNNNKVLYYESADFGYVRQFSTIP